MGTKEKVLTDEEFENLQAGFYVRVVCPGFPFSGLLFLLTRVGEICGFKRKVKLCNISFPCLEIEVVAEDLNLVIKEQE